MAVATYDAKLARYQEEQRLQRHRDVPYYSGPKVKFEETGFYKALVRTGDIEEELTRIRDLIRRRTDPSYEADDGDFGVKPVRSFDVKVDYYKLLDVDDFATAKDVKAAYRKLVLQYHPDKNRDKGPEELKAMQDEFEKIQDAYEVLSDRVTRRQYDRAKFDGVRAKSQGMSTGWYDRNDKSGRKENYWSGWSARKTGARAPDGGGNRAPVLPKARELRVEVRISLDKALHGGIKIIDVKRDRMQRSTGGASKAAKTFHVPIELGQADGSEYRLEGDGHWPSFNERPGDLVFEFRHKPHANLRQDAAATGLGGGSLKLVKPLHVRATARERVLTAWSFTFKRQVVVVRFLNPLSAIEPCKSWSVLLRLEGEGLRSQDPCAGVQDCGALTVPVVVELSGPAPAASCAGPLPCRSVLTRRRLRRFNCQGHATVTLRRASSSPEARFLVTAEGVQLAAIASIWAAPTGMDAVKFVKAASALGWHAQRDPASYLWGHHGALSQCALPASPLILRRGEILASGGACTQEAVEDPLYPLLEEFLVRFGLGPPGGFAPPQASENAISTGTLARAAAAPGALRPVAPDRGTSSSNRLDAGAAEVCDGEDEDDEEIVELIKLKESEIAQLQQSWTAKCARLRQRRDDEEGVLKELLEKDRAREKKRIEKEMSSLQQAFESQVQREEKWRAEFMANEHYNNDYCCVFRPAMVSRSRPNETAPIVRKILFNDVVKAKGKPTDDHWIQIASATQNSGRADQEWALTWHPKHGRLLQKWFGAAQSRFLELEEKIEARRKTRNETFLEYRQKKKEVDEWTIPPGPSPEEQVELDDDESEQLHSILAPPLAELRAAKRRLRELRKARVEAAEAASLRSASGAAAIASNGALPAGLVLEDVAVASASKQQAAPSSQPESPRAVPQAWETKKRLADDAVAQQGWHMALALYSEALDLGGCALGSQSKAATLANRALVQGKLGDWERSFEDATAATAAAAGWPKAWLRRATAELRLGRPRSALASLHKGFACWDGISGQVPSSSSNAPSSSVASALVGAAMECESALYDGDGVGIASDGEADAAPRTVAERIRWFRDQGTAAFSKGDIGSALFHFTRSRCHRSMMDGHEEAVLLSNRSAAFLKLGLGAEALGDASAAAERFPSWPKPLVRAGQAALLSQDLAAAYRHFAGARRMDKNYDAANDGVDECLRRIAAWTYPEAMKRWGRFTSDRGRRREELRIWALSDVHFDQRGSPEWCKSLSSTFFRNDVLLLAGNVADCLKTLKFCLTVLKSKFRRIFYVPGNRDLWVRRATLQDIVSGGKVPDDEAKAFGDSVTKLLEVLRVCDELGVDTAPAEVAEGLFVAPLFSWYSRDFVPRALRKRYASAADVDAGATFDPWVAWPFACGHDDASRFFARMNEPVLRATLHAKASYERLSGQLAEVVTMAHFLPRAELPVDWTVPGIWDHVGCGFVDDQIRALGSALHVYGRACFGDRVTSVDGVHYVHNFVGMPDQHRPGMAPWCVFDRGRLLPEKQPVQENGFNFQPLAPPEPQVRFAGG